ncbi:MAG: hypothetical protein AAGI91_16460 [Bacteroidota bacterium]
MRLAAFLVLLTLLPAAQAQQEGVLQVGDALSRTLLRQQALGRLDGAFLSNQPLSAYAARAYADSTLGGAAPLGRADRSLLERYVGLADGPGVAAVRRRVPFLYTNGSSFYSVRAEDYGLELSPLATLSYGRARNERPAGSAAATPVWQNTRGVRAAGHIGPHVFFESRLLENQRRVARPAFFRDTAPRLGGNIKFPGETTYDYFVATGLVGFRSKFFEARLGRDRNRWGFGRTSLFLSDYATVYDQVQLRTSFWRIHYTNLYARFSSLRPPGDRFAASILPRKYGVFHRLALDLPGRVQLELFESVVFVTDTTGANRRTGFDFAYANPIIFYRAVEHDLGSPDNVLLGAGFSWVATPGVQVYAQGLLDELRAEEFFNDWWGNRWGYQLGLFLVDPGIGARRLRDFDLRIEYARQRPFLYSHRSEGTSYLHFNDLLGHPAGPNTSDLALSASYRPTPRLWTTLDLAFTRRGRSPDDGRNFGDNPARSFEVRDFSLDDSTETLQGVRQRLMLAEARVGYEVLPSLFAEVALRAESVDDAERGLDRYVAPFASLRWGVPFQSVRY